MTYLQKNLLPLFSHNYLITLINFPKVRLRPPALLICPNCTNSFIRSRVASVNNFGAQLFSDGKQIGTMYREFPLITKCKKCQNFFWVNEAEVIDEEWKNDKLKMEWKNADSIEFLNIEELFESLNLEIIRNKDQEGFIRKHIWWAYNDRLRESKKLFLDADDEIKWRQNILRLKDIIDPTDDNTRILVAEMNRNLGNFAECLRLINSLTDRSFEWIAERFRSMCADGDKTVFILKW